MPREKQFNVDSVLENAMRAFWAHGYSATSTQNLVDCMGINRASLYATFGDKRTLFIKALRRYDKHYREGWMSALSAKNSPKNAILAVFNSVVDTVVRDGDRNGCLLINTALELSPHDEEIGKIVAKYLSAAESFFCKMIEQGQETKEISTDIDSQKTAQLLLSMFIGLRVLSRSRPEQLLLRSISHQAEVILN